MKIIVVNDDSTTKEFSKFIAFGINEPNNMRGYIHNMDLLGLMLAKERINLIISKEVAKTEGKQNE